VEAAVAGVRLSLPVESEGAVPDQQIPKQFWLQDSQRLPTATHRAMGKAGRFDAANRNESVGLLYQRCINQFGLGRAIDATPTQVVVTSRKILERAMGIEPTTFSLGS
jgi:hypothetical protein